MDPTVVMRETFEVSDNWNFIDRMVGATLKQVQEVLSENNSGRNGGSLRERRPLTRVTTVVTPDIS